MAKDYTYRNLVLWQRSQAMALQVIRIVRTLPNDWANAVVARQAIAAATSVSANIAEGHGRFTPGAHSNHLSIAKGSAAETDSWLDLLHRMGYLSAEEEQSLHESYLWIMAALTGKIRDLQQLSRKDRDQVGETGEPYHWVADSQGHEPVWPFVEGDYQNTDLP